MTENGITARDKQRCAEREVKMRERVYKKRVEQGYMTPTTADREIAIMRAIAEDYRAQELAEMEK